MSTYHTPVLLTETLEAMNLKPGATVVDVTLGGGGHAGEVMQRISPAGHLIGLDRDAQALSAARSRLNQVTEAGAQVRIDLVQDRFDSLAQHLEALKITQVDAILADLGVSSHQLNASERGFSFQTEAPLDMRMDQSQGETAQELIHRLSEQELTQVLRDYGEESLSRPLARMIKQAEAEGRLNTTTELALLVENVSRRRYRTPSRVHPATRTFQALRIAVNQEMEALKAFLPQALEALRPGGRLAVITFHSLEDRIVKQFIQHEAKGCICPPEIPVCRCGHQPRLKSIFKKPLTASDQEVNQNPRARSAKLRVAERI